MCSFSRPSNVGIVRLRNLDTVVFITVQTAVDIRSRIK